MRTDFEPLLQPVEIVDLRPTQMTVGMREVRFKRAEWRSRAATDASDFLGRHLLPAVLGPKKRPYIVDNHHLARALHDEGVKHVLIHVIGDLGSLEKPAFWTFMDCRNWLHPFDADGVRKTHRDLPRSVDDMIDDPYRSLAGELRRAGGYAKDPTPNSEFLWADYLRRLIDRKSIEKDFEKTVAEAVGLAHRKDAAYLPGWCGPAGDAD